MPHAVGIRRLQDESISRPEPTPPLLEIPEITENSLMASRPDYVEVIGMGAIIVMTCAMDHSELSFALTFRMDCHGSTDATKKTPDIPEFSPRQNRPVYGHLIGVLTT